MSTWSSFILALIGSLAAFDQPVRVQAIPGSWVSDRYIRRESGARSDQEDVHAESLGKTFDTPELTSLVRLQSPLGADQSSPTSRKGLTLAGTCCNRSGSANKHLPSMDQFRRLWQGKMDLDRAEPEFGKRFKTPMKLVLGVFSQSKEVDARLVMRQTWLQQPGVCIAGHGVKETCTVYAAFILGQHDKKGKPLNVSADWESPDLFNVFHDAPSIWKLREFLLKAPNAYPWATHFGKMDSDTFVHVTQMVPRVPMPNLTCEVFFGTSILSHGCGLHEITPASENDPEVFRACMHGALYLVSRNLLIGMSNKQGEIQDWLSGKHQDIGEEDIAFGMAVTSYVRRTKTCLHVAEAGLKDDPAGAFDHCGVNCGNVFSHGKFR